MRKPVRPRAQSQAGFLESDAPTTEIRLQKYLADSGIASRRHSEVLIAEGHVTVNGVVVTQMGTKIHPRKDEVQVYGKLVHTRTSTAYYLFNKPRGVVVTASDPEGRRTIYEYLEHIRERVVPIGRLDRDSEGLLLLTNDGELAHRLMHPSYGIEKEYHVLVEGSIGDDELTMLRQGIEIEPGVRTKPAEVRVIPNRQRAWQRDSDEDDETHDAPEEDEESRPRGPGPRPEGRDLLHHLQGRGKQNVDQKRSRKSGRQDLQRTWLSITIREGRKRQVRLMINAIGGDVRRLRRMREGSLELGDLAYGRTRRLTNGEISALKQEVGLEAIPETEDR